MSPQTLLCNWPSRSNSLRAPLPPASLPNCRCRRWVARAEVAGAGFINLFLTNAAKQQVVRRVCEQGYDYGRGKLGADRKVQVEFVSANPTGPLHVGHGRGAAYGASLCQPARFRRLPRDARVLCQRRRPPDGHPGLVRLATLPGTVQRQCGLSAQRLPGQLCAGHGRADSRCPRRPLRAFRRGRAVRRAAAAAGGAQGCRVRRGPGSASRRASSATPRNCSATTSPTSTTTSCRSSSPTAATIWPNSAYISTTGSRRDRCSTPASSTAPWRSSKSTATSIARTAPSGSAPPPSATRRTAWSSARTGSTPTSPPTSPIT